MLSYVAAALVGVWLLRWYCKGSSCTRPERMDGKTVVITGCNTGIGKETALELSRRGARIAMACRNPKLAEAVAEDIRMETGGEVKVYLLDLSSLSSVKECAQQINSSEERVDVLINNAGVSMLVGEMLRSKEGHELHFGTNHLGHFLLTNLLVDKMQKSGSDARVLTVSSLVCKLTSLDFADLDYTSRPYNNFMAYSSSKLANVLFNAELARRLEGTGVVSVTLNPGIVNSDIKRHLLDWAHPVLKVILAPLAPLVFNVIMKTCREGAQTTLHCALTPELTNGAYYSECREEKLALDETEARRLWEVSSKMVGLSSVTPSG